ncbi:MAG: murein biosynthesis integral membrane protein MurJ [Anaerolineaceae bacterium]|nr:murein biosynthesis integral membrane protein MurJ [Anaerolineaceae bacterium]
MMTEQTPRTRQLARSTLTVMLAFGVAKAISLAQTFIIAKQVGVGSEWDTFVTANRVPELIFTLISGGALAHAFIPVFTGFLAQGDKEKAWRVATHVINTIFTATLITSAVVFLFANPIAASVAPGFAPAEIEQTAQIMRNLLVGTLIFSVSGISMGILNSHNHFLLPALAPIMFDVGILIGVIFLLKPLGVQGIAIGAVLGAAMHFTIQIPGLIHFKARWWPELGLRDPVMWYVIRLMLPRVAGLGVVSLNFLVMNNIASRLGEGSVSALDWGWRLMQIPETLIGTAMGTVIFPTLATLSELGDERGKRGAMSGALRFILIATIPSAVGLIVVGQPLISLLERGAFDAAAATLVYSTLRFFALGLVVHSALEIVARSFYADKDTLTPLFAALGGAAINLILSLTLSGVAQVETMRIANTTASMFPLLNLPTYTGNVGGLALANSCGVAFEVLVLLWVLRRRWHGMEESTIGKTVLKTTAASLVMALAIVIIDMVWHTLGLADQGFAYTVLRLGVEVGGGVLVFAGVAYLMKMEELQTLLTLILRRQRTEGIA